MRLQPKRASGHGWIDASLSPPCGFIAAAVNLAMMSSTQRHGELIAHLAAECAVLGEAQMMRIRWSSAANETRLLGDKLDVVLVTKAARFRVGQAALVDVVGSRSLASVVRAPNSPEIRMRQAVTAHR